MDTPVASSPLARMLFPLYVLLVAYASLYPLTNWRDPSAPLLEFLFVPWPPYDTRLDVVANVIGYLPYGMLLVLAAYPGLKGISALVVAVLSAAALSFGLETAQNYVPQRHASTLDLAANTLGATAGALVALACTPWLLQGGPLRGLRTRFLRPGSVVDVGLVLLSLWVFIQLNPATLLFGVGDLRDLFVPPEGSAYAPAVFIGAEALIATCNTVALAFLLSLIAVRYPRGQFLILVFLALAVKTAAFAIVMRSQGIFAWLTPGALQGLLAGVVFGLVAIDLPRGLRLMLAALLLMAASILVNLAPPNPYLAATLAVWHQGHFLNFNGLTRLVAVLWPFAALAFLIYLATQPVADRRARKAGG